MHRHTTVLLGGMVVALAASSVQSQVPLTPEATQPSLRTVAIGANPQHVYQAGLNRFAVTPNPLRVEALRENPDVDNITQDAVASAADDPLGVSVWCDHSSSFCDATAYGGSGSGYSFLWSHAWGASQIEYYSWANTEPECGWWMRGYPIDVSVTVTDSNNATATAYTQAYCQ